MDSKHEKIEQSPVKKPYSIPKLLTYGTITVLTQGSAISGSDGGQGSTMMN